MRISFTALTGGGPRDVVIDMDSEITVGGVARFGAVELGVEARGDQAGKQQDANEREQDHRMDPGRSGQFG